MKLWAIVSTFAFPLEMKLASVPFPFWLWARLPVSQREIVGLAFVAALSSAAWRFASFSDAFVALGVVYFVRLAVASQACGWSCGPGLPKATGKFVTVPMQTVSFNNDEHI